MKKAISLLLGIMMMFSSTAVLAEELLEEFNIDDAVLCINRNDDGIVLMGAADVYAEFEKRLVEAWTDMTPDDPKTDDVFENGVWIGDLKIEKTDIVEMYSKVYFENPLFYYVERGFNGATVAGQTYMAYVVPRYNETDKSVIEATWEKIDKATEEILLYIHPDMTDFEKVMAVHDYMALNYTYDIKDPDQTLMILIDKSGVCAAYSEAFIHVMNVLGIEATAVKSDEMGHMWNLVNVGGKWSHIDIVWDDITPDRFAMVYHKYALLSSNAMKNAGYYEFETDIMTSTTYNKAEWRDDEGAIVTVGGVMYRVEGENLVDENGNVIYENLDGGDGKWSIGGGYVFSDAIYAGVCELNGMLYFSTDAGIYSYNPETEEISVVLEHTGICGVYADKNVLRYNRFDTTTNTFIESGEIRVADIRLVKPYYENGEAVVRLYNDFDVPIWIISEGDGYKIKKVEAKSVETAKFDNGDEQTIYVWKDSLEPVSDKMVIVK